MTDLQQRNQECGVLRWGGLAGLLGAFLFILVMIFVTVFIPSDPKELSGWVIRFPGIQGSRVVENIIYLLALLLEIPLFLALFSSLRKTNLASALFGSTLAIVGLVSMVVSTTPHVAHSTLSQLFHTPGATAADQATVAILWQAVRGIFDAMLYVGFFVIPVGLIILGMGMFTSPSYGKVFSSMITALGLVGLIAAILQMIDPASIIGVGSYFACLISYLMVGLKLHKMSK